MSCAKYFRHTVAEINLSSVRHNFNAIKKILGPQSFICPMVKANAYGHGDVAVSQALVVSGAERLGVCLVEEGVRLRENGINVPILIFDYFDSSGAKAILEYQLTPVVSTWDQLEWLKNLKNQGPPLPVHIKFNTGMNRLGFEIGEAAKIADFLQHTNSVLLQGVCTHLRNGEDAGETLGVSEDQIKKLISIRSFLPYKNIRFHVLNSSALFNLAALNKVGEYQNLGARPGLAIYGIAPQINGSLQPDLKPVMQIKSQLIASRYLEPGMRVSYGGRWVAEKKSVIGVVPIGYEDGYFRSLSNKGQMLYRGQKVPVIGTVCMDYTMIDLTKVSGGMLGQVGEEVIILGCQGQNEINASQLGEWANTISYEVLTSVGQRVPRVYVR